MGTHAAPEVRRAQILEAALGCFAEKGYHSTKMDDIVRVCGLSKGAIYWHFESKEEIFLALFSAMEAEIFAAWEAVDEGDALESLRRDGEIVFERLAGTRMFLDAWSEFLRHPSARERFAALYRGSRARLATTVRRGIERGEIRDLSPEAAAATLTGVVEGILLQAFVDPGYDPRSAWPTAWEILERGLQA